MSITKEHYIESLHGCSACGEMKVVGQFRQRAVGKYENICNKCRVEQITQWQDRNREQTRANQRQYFRRTKGRAVMLLNGARERARKKGDPFKLVLSDIERALEIGMCEKTFTVFDLEPFENATQSPFAPSVDKKDPNGIYEPSNVQYVCFWYNSAKQQWPETILIQMCKLVARLNP